jgi:hypothetical protein
MCDATCSAKRRMCSSTTFCAAAKPPRPWRPAGAWRRKPSRRRTARPVRLRARSAHNSSGPGCLGSRHKRRVATCASWAGTACVAAGGGASAGSQRKQATPPQSSSHRLPGCASGEAPDAVRRRSWLPRWSGADSSKASPANAKLTCLAALGRSRRADALSTPLRGTADGCHGLTRSSLRVNSLLFSSTVTSSREVSKDW